MACAALALLACAAYWGHWRGEFVYDDRYQIQANGLLRTWSGTWQAMGEDVWAFKGERPEAWSNYWRPGFIAWLALNCRLFGIESPVGWHWTSWLLHFGACCLAWRLLLRVGLPPGPAGFAVAVFAVHPAHVESVAWISGATDVLATCLLLAALLLLPADGKPRWSWRWAGCLALFALALASKEVALLGALLVVLGDRCRASRPSLAVQLWRAAPFALLSALFLVARRAVLGAHEIDLPWQLSVADRLVTLPRLLAFYLRQALLPFQLSPAYPLRVLDSAEAAVADWMALLLAAVLAVLALLLLRGRPRLQLAFGFFALPLLPALNVSAFHPEQLVHDRYLYLPILGAWTLLALLTSRALARRFPRRRAAGVLAATSVVLLLAAATRRYLPVWRSERALWERAVDVDPGSAFNQALHGRALLADGDLAAARAALDRSISIFPGPLALIARGDLLLRTGDLAAARRDLARVIAVQPTNTAAVERLALVLQRGGALSEAEDLLRHSRALIPHHRCALTTDLAVVLYLRGSRAGALAELEAAAPTVTPASPSNCQTALFHLGELYLELGRPTPAAAAHSRFLEVTRGTAEPRLLDLRRRASARLAGASARP